MSTRAPAEIRTPPFPLSDVGDALEHATDSEKNASPRGCAARTVSLRSIAPHGESHEMLLASAHQDLFFSRAQGALANTEKAAVIDLNYDWIIHAPAQLTRRHEHRTGGQVEHFERPAAI